MTLNVGVLLRNRSVLDSFGGDEESLAAVLDLLASGDLALAVTEISFDEIGEGTERLHAGNVAGRLVARL